MGQVNQGGALKVTIKVRKEHLNISENKHAEMGKNSRGIKHCFFLGEDGGEGGVIGRGGWGASLLLEPWLNRRESER